MYCPVDLSTIAEEEHQVQKRIIGMNECWVCGEGPGSAGLRKICQCSVEHSAHKHCLIDWVNTLYKGRCPRVCGLQCYTLSLQWTLYLNLDLDKESK
eukprot:sb/3479006/